MKSTNKHTSTTTKRSNDYAPTRAQKMARASKRAKIDRARVRDELNMTMFARF